MVLVATSLVSFGLMSFRPHVTSQELVQGKVIVKNTNVKTGTAAVDNTTCVAAVGAALDEAALAVYEATPAVAEFAAVSAALLATPTTDGQVSTISNDAYINKTIKVKAYQLDKK